MSQSFARFWTASLLLLTAMPQSTVAAVRVVPLFKNLWINGERTDEPQTQVQAIDGDTFVIRQSVRTNFEAPFLYLLFGRESALLLDTGAEGLNVRPLVDRIVKDWLRRHHRRSIRLIVAHSHNHRDHRANDAAFADRPDTTLVGLAVPDVARFFGIARWPDDLGHFDLGGRMLDVIPTPGHQLAHIMIYDRRTRLLLSGDALYPGRLTIPVNHFAAERASIDRIADFARSHKVRYVLGAHVEMTAISGKDIEGGAPTHPNEHRLELPPSAIFDLQRRLRAMREPYRPQVSPDFIIEPIPARPD